VGIETAIMTSIGLQLGSSIFQGVEADRVGKAQQKLEKEQAAIAISEAKSEAGRLRLQNRISNARLKLQFLQQGVSPGGGSAANVLATGINLQREEVRAVLDRGQAQAQLSLDRGRVARNEGRASLIGGIIGGVSSAVGTFSQAKAFGAFNKPSTDLVGASKVNQSPGAQLFGTMRA
jgi:hypothetical protein